MMQNLKNLDFQILNMTMKMIALMKNRRVKASLNLHMAILAVLESMQGKGKFQTIINGGKRTLCL